MYRIIFAAIAGTSCMTAYSYWKSRRKKEKFKEPLLLNQMGNRLAPQYFSEKETAVTGWVIHYAIGLGFNMAYHLWWKHKAKGPGIMDGIMAGVPSGMIAIVVWHVSFKLHPAPPETHLKKFHQQLFVAHLIFGMTSALGYKHSTTRK